ncbi:hypothetical protein [Polaromonas sp. JS666]|uniref:hypothetical protein n=1 Tax=Polaromonas sp. (strain JS666 / ATCC BAA-500) TaxID=296591 RepID=UPI000053755A|nr:hypothetical protein [Polaromonas sp. JS666]ABE43866.1 conserved hypothetical protein [Polaromonas sp. JS666]
MNTQLQESHSPAASCSVLLYEHRAPRRANNSIKLKLGDHVRIKAEHIQRYCFVEGDPLQDDLAAVLSGVRMADRACNRQHSKGWARNLNVEVPVYDLCKWQSAEVMGSLTDALRYLTGDQWHFEFKQRKERPGNSGQAHLVDLPAQERVFMPYSNGLDSFALANQVQRDSSTTELILINVQAAHRLTNWKNLGRARDKDMQAVQVAVFFNEPHRTEPSFRSRPFIYDMLAGYGASLAQPAKVVIPENGQGSLGGSLVPLGDEAPHRSCHPGFTSRLTRLVNALTNVTVRFEHPALFQTKGQVLAQLASQKSASEAWLAGHRSCSYDARHSSQDKRSMHCGVCGNCLLRRVALKWTGIEDTTDYRADDLTATTFEGSFRGIVPRIHKSNHDVAFNSIRAMQRMADLANSPQNTRVATEAASLSRALGEPIQEVRTQLEKFLKQHQTEWSQFLDECGPQSWVADLARN